MLTYLFPGQGSQTKGMGGSLFNEYPDLIAQADAILGYSVRDLCLCDQTERLNDTLYTQPALFVVNTLYYHNQIDTTGIYPDFVAGHSLGEYNALYASGAITFTNGLKLVKKRAELMSLSRGGAMAAIVKLSLAQVMNVLKKAGQQLGTVQIANYNSSQQFVISGVKNDVFNTEQFFVDAGGLFFPLKTSGAFHSCLMEYAAHEFSHFVSSFNFSPMKIPVIANINAKPYDQNDIADNLTAQLAGAVRWQETIEYLLDHAVLNQSLSNKTEMQFEELGPGSVLNKLNKQIKSNFVPKVKVNPKESTELSAEIRIVRWNETHPIGTLCTVQGYEQVMETSSKAILLFGHRVAIYMSGFNGYFSLDDVLALS